MSFLNQNECGPSESSLQRAGRRGLQMHEGGLELPLVSKMLYLVISLQCQCSHPLTQGTKGGVSCPCFSLVPGRELVLGTCPSSCPLKLWYLAQGNGFFGATKIRITARGKTAPNPAQLQPKASAPLLPGASTGARGRSEGARHQPSSLLQSSFIRRAV